MKNYECYDVHTATARFFMRVNQITDLANYENRVRQAVDRFEFEVSKKEFNNKEHLEHCIGHLYALAMDKVAPEPKPGLRLVPDAIEGINEFLSED